jgi:hypothetical protein
MLESVFGISKVRGDEPVTTPCPLFHLASFSRALVRVGRPLTVIEQKPILKKALQARPTVVTVALDNKLVIKLKERSRAISCITR